MTIRAQMARQGRKVKPVEESVQHPQPKFPEGYVANRVWEGLPEGAVIRDPEGSFRRKEKGNVTWKDAPPATREEALRQARDNQMQMSQALQEVMSQPVVSPGMQLEAVKKVPEHMRPMLLRMAEDTMLQQPETPGVVKGMALGAVRGTLDMGQAGARAAFGRHTEALGQQVETLRQLQNIQRGAEPLYDETTPWYEKVPVQAAEMAPYMIGMGRAGGGLGRVVGQEAARVGLGKAGVAAATKAGQIAGMAAVGGPLMLEQSRDGMRALGVSEEIAGPAAAVSTGVSLAIESILPEPLRLVGVKLGKTIFKTVANIAKEMTKQGIVEWGEEFADALQKNLIQHAATKLDQEAPDLKLGDQLWTAIKEGAQAGPPLAVLMGVGGGVSGVREAGARKAGVLHAKEARKSGEYLTSPAGAQQFARVFPSVSQVIAGMKGTPTKEQWAGLHLPPTNPSGRAKFQQHLRDLQPPPGLEELRALREQGDISRTTGRRLNLTPKEMTDQKSRTTAVDQRIQELEKEVQDSGTIPSTETEVRVEEGGADIRGPGKVEVPAVPASEVAPAPEVPVAQPELKSDPWSNVSDWVRSNLEPLAQRAEDSGLADRVEELAAQRLTAKQIAKSLGIDQDMVNAVRIQRGIPSMSPPGMGVTSGPAVESQEFKDWLSKRKATTPTEGAVPVAQPQPTTTTPPLPTVAPATAPTPGATPPAAAMALSPQAPATWRATATEIASRAVDTSTEVQLPDLFQKLQSQYPELTVEEFQKGMIELRDQGAVQLREYTRKPADVVGKVGTIQVPPDNLRPYGELLYYVRAGETRQAPEAEAVAPAVTPTEVPPAPVPKPTRTRGRKAAPPAQEPAPDQSEFSQRVNSFVAEVPAMQGASVEVNEEKRTATVTTKSGHIAVIHFDADAELDIAEKHAKGAQRGRKGRGAYVYQPKTGAKKQALAPGIYLRSTATHETLNHEVVHWLEDQGIITPQEVKRGGGRESIADAYVKWVSSGDQKKPNTLFQKIWNAVENLIGINRLSFRAIEARATTAQEPALEQPPELAQAGVTVTKSKTGWVVKGLAKETGDGLREQYHGKRRPNGSYLFKEDPTERVVDAVRTAAEETQRVAAAGARGLVATRIGDLTPEETEWYEQERKERLDQARQPYDAVEELLSQYVKKSARGEFKLRIRRALETQDADKIKGFDYLVDYAKEHPELGLPQDETELLELLASKSFVFDEKVAGEEIDEQLAGELNRLRLGESGEIEFPFGANEVPATGKQTAIPGFEGDVERIEQSEQAKRAKAGIEGKPATQQPLFGKSGLPGQQNLFPDTGVPDDMVQQQETGEGGGIAQTAAVPTRQSRTARRRAEGEAAGIAAADIMKTAERIFKVAIRIGGFSQRAAGIYKWITKRSGPPSPEVVRTAEDHYANLAVVAHEVAHHIDETTKVVRSMPKDIRDEVKGLDYQPEKGRAFEGWAEFLRRYMTEPPIDVGDQQIPNPGLDAPRTLAWFENTFLPAHEDLARQISLFRGYAQQFAQQSVFQRVGTLISDRMPQDLSFKERWLKKSRRFVNRLKTDYIDKFHTLEWIQTEARRRGYGGIGIYDLTMAHFLSATSHATIAFEEGVRSLQEGRPIGTTSLWGLREHLESDGEYDDAVLYALARHTLFMDEAKPGYNTGMDVADAEALIAEVEESGKKDRYEAFARGLAQFNNDLIQMLVEAGALPAREAAAMLHVYKDQNYFPLHRVQDVEHSMFAGSGVGFVNLGKAVPGRSAKGSGRQIIDPIDATVNRAIRFYGRAIQARQATILAEALDPLLGGVGGMGGFMDRVSPGKRVTQGTIDEIAKTLVDEGILEADDVRDMRIAAKIRDPQFGMPSDASIKWFAERHGIQEEDGEYDQSALEEAADLVPDIMAQISLWRPDYTPNAQKRTVVIYDKNGKPLMYEMDPDLYATATGMDELKFSGFVSLVREASRFFKTGAVGASTGFGTANLLRDYWEFQGKARHTKGLASLGKPPVMLGRYIAEKARKATGHKSNNALIRLYEESGGKVYSVIGHDVHSRRMYRRRRIGKSTMSKLGLSVKRPMDTAEGALQALQDIIAISDAPPRLADAEAAIKEEGYVVQGDKWLEVATGNVVDYLPEHVRIKAAIAFAEATINFKRIGAKGQYIEAFVPFFNAAVQASYRQYQQVKGLKSLGKKDVEGVRARRYMIYLSALAAESVVYWLLRHDDDDWREQDAYLRDGYWTYGTNGKTYVRIPKPRDTAVVANVVENMLDAWYHEDARDTSDVLLRDFGQRIPTGGGLVRGGIETYIAKYDYFRDMPLVPRDMEDMPKELQITPYTSRASDAIGSVTGRYLGTSPIQVEHLLSSASGGSYRRLTDLYDAAVDGRLGPEHIPFVRGLVINRQQARTVNTFYDEMETVSTASKREMASTGKVSDETVGKQAVLMGHAELMTKLRELEGKVGKKRSYEYQQYIVGLARHALGYTELPSSPNPLTAKDVPEDVKAAAKDYSMRAANKAGQVEKDKDTYKDAEEYESARRTRLRGEAELKNLGVSHDEAQQLLLDYHRRPDREEGTERIKGKARLEKGYMARASALSKLYGEKEDAWVDWYKAQMNRVTLSQSAR